MTCKATPEHLSCTACSLHKTRNLVVPGHGNFQATIALIGEGPGKNEDITGEPFTGRAGSYLSRLLVDVGLCRLVSCETGAACIRHDARARWSLGEARFRGQACNTHESIAREGGPGSVSPVDERVMRVIRARIVADQSSAMLALAARGGDAYSASRTGLHQKLVEVPQEELSQLRPPLSEDSGIYNLADELSSDQDSRRRLYNQQDTQVSCRYCTIASERCQPVFLDNVVSCRPEDNDIKRAPDAVSTCPDLWLLKGLAEMPNLQVIVAMGATAGSLWFTGRKATELSKLARRLSNGTLIIGCFHPSYAMREGEWVDESIRASLRRAITYATMGGSR